MSDSETNNGLAKDSDAFEAEPIELDEYLDEMEGISWYQIRLIVSATLVVFSACTVTTLPIFLSATPEYRCAFPLLDNSNVPDNVTEFVTSKLIPHTDNQELNSCHRYAFNASDCATENITSSCSKANFTDMDLVSCDEYHYNRDVYKESITTEWDLVCGRVVLKSVANSAMFFGFFIGSLVAGIIADWFGRKKSMLVFSLVVAVFGFAVALSPSYTFYLVFFILFCGGSIGEYIVAYTYVSEVSNRKRRRDILLCVSLFGAFGDVVISPAAYFLRHWRYIAIFCAVIPLFYVPCHFFVTESPRWFLSVGREKSAKKVVMKYFASKGKQFREELWERVLEAERLKRQEARRRRKYSILDLFRTPYVRLVSFNVMVTWFVVSIVYYGLVLNIGNLAGDPYVNGFLNSLLDIIASFVMIFAMRVLSKSYLLCGSFLLAGFSCIGSMLALQAGAVTTSVILAFIGRLGAASAYKIAYVLTTEIFPTVVRSTGLSLGSGSSRIGGMISPFTVEAQESIPWLMQTIFGTLSIIAGILSLGFPDTNNVGLMSTLEEAEDFCAENMPKICRRKNALTRRRFTSPFLKSDEQGEDGAVML